MDPRDKYPEVDSHNFPVDNPEVPAGFEVEKPGTNAEGAKDAGRIPLTDLPPTYRSEGGVEKSKYADGDGPDRVFPTATHAALKQAVNEAAKRAEDQKKAADKAGVRAESWHGPDRRSGIDRRVFVKHSEWYDRNK